ncbi:autotransporter domain-containing protein, partial [Campylobacter sp. FMV-PI01]
TNLYLTRLNSDKIKLSSDEIKFHSTNSIRAKMGARYSKPLTDSLTAYLGASFEREFASKVKATNLTKQKSIQSPSLKGNTISGELGLKFTPFTPLIFDLQIQGLSGKKRGLSTGFNVEFRF